MNEALTDHDDTPAECDDRQLPSSTDLSQEQVGGHLEEDVWDEEHQQGDTVVGTSGKLEFLSGTCDTGGGQVGSVDQGNRIESTENGEKAAIDLGANTLDFSGVKARVDVLEG